MSDGKTREPQPSPIRIQRDLAKLSADRLERLLLKLVRYSNEVDKEKGCSGGGTCETLKCPIWWPNDVIFATFESMRQEATRTPMTWCQILRKAAQTCYEFYKKLDETEMCKYTARIETQPLTNIVNTYSVKSPQKRKKSIKLRPIASPSSAKERFMESLALTNKCVHRTKKPDDIETKNYNSNIPFSSDIGRILMQRDRYTLSQELFNRKSERVNYYLKEIPVTQKNKTYGVTYHATKKTRSAARLQHTERVYNFPRRNARQYENYANHLKKFVCKPCTVHIVRLDYTTYLKQIHNCRKLTVNVTRLPNFK